MKLATTIFAIFVAVAAAGKTHHDACDEGHETPAPPTLTPTVTPTVSPTPSPAPTVEEPTPAPTVEEPTPAPTVEEPTPVPTVEEPTPVPTVEEPTPVPTVEEPTPAPTVEEPTPAPTVEEPTPVPTVEEPTPAPSTLSPPVPMPDNDFSDDTSYDWGDDCKGSIRTSKSELTDDVKCRDSFKYLTDDEVVMHACFKCEKNYAFDLTKKPYIMCDGMPICSNMDSFLGVTPKQLKCLHEVNGAKSATDACGLF